MKNNVFKVVLLQALPASGKSEVRNFMAHVEPGRLQEEFHIGENLQLDDFPYVHMMRRRSGYFTPVKSPSRTAGIGALCVTCSMRTITTL